MWNLVLIKMGVEQQILSSMSRNIVNLNTSDGSNGVLVVIIERRDMNIRIIVVAIGHGRRFLM
jgi:hypothetical protein